MAKKKKVIQEDVQVVKPVADPPEQLRANGTGEGEKNDRSVIDEAQSVTDVQPLVTGKTNAQQVTQQVPPKNVNVGEGYTPVVKTQESRNGGQPGDNINNPVGATTTTTTTTTTNEGTQQGTDGLGVYEPNRAYQTPAVSHPNYAKAQTDFAKYDVATLEQILAKQDEFLADPDASPERRERILAARQGVADLIGKKKAETVGTEKKEDVKPQGNTTTDTQGNGDVVAPDTDKEPEYTNRKQDKTDGTTTNKEAAKLPDFTAMSDDDLKNAVVPSDADEDYTRKFYKGVSETLASRGYVWSDKHQQWLNKPYKEGGASNGTEKGGQSADGTTSTSPAYDAYKASNDFAKAYVTGEAGNETFNPDTKLRVGGDAYAKKLEDTRTKIANGEKVSLQDRIALMKHERLYGKTFGDGTEGNGGDGTISEKELEAQQKIQDLASAKSDKDKILEGMKENNVPQQMIDYVDKNWDTYQDYFRSTFKSYLDIDTDPNYASDPMPVEPGKPELRTGTPTYDSLLKSLEARRETPEQKAKREKKEKRIRAIATIGDVIVSFANIWGASKGATAFKQTSLTGTHESNLKAEKQMALKQAENDRKELETALKRDLKVNETENKSILALFDGQYKAYLAALNARNQKDRLRFAQKAKEMNSALKFVADMYLAQQKADNALTLQKQKDDAAQKRAETPKVQHITTDGHKTVDVRNSYDGTSGAYKPGQNH